MRMKKDRKQTKKKDEAGYKVPCSKYLDTKTSLDPFLKALVAKKPK